MDDNLHNDTTDIDEEVYDDIVDDLDDFPGDIENEAYEAYNDIPTAAGESVIDQYMESDRPHKNIGERVAETIQTEGKIIEGTGKAMEAAGKGVEMAGKGVEATGKAVEATGAGIEMTGKGIQAVGKGTEAVGKGVSSAGKSMVDAGAELSSTGVGAIAGVPLAAVGGVATAAGKTTEVGGKAVNAVGKGTEKTGKAVKETGKKIGTGGKKIGEAGKKINDTGKKVKDIGKDVQEKGSQLKNKKELKRLRKELKNAKRQSKENLRKYHNNKKQARRYKEESEEEIKEKKKRIRELKKREKESKLKDKDAALKLPLKLTMIMLIVVILSTFFLFLLLFIVINSFIWWDSSGSGGSGGSSTSVGTGGVYQMSCSTMAVIKPDNTVQTYKENDYIAGVVAAEVGGFVNEEVYKAFAIAARTYGEREAIDHQACSIKGDASAQAFTDITGSEAEYAKMIYKVVEETESVVLLKNDQVLFSQYDAFCYVEKDSEKYTLSQKRQEIPVSWVEANVYNYGYKNCPCEAKDPNRTDCWDSNNNWTDGGHGNGMSQYGALYLATEKGYTYDQILAYYYGEDVELSSQKSPGITAIAGLDVKDTTNAQELHEPLSTFLPSRGTSVDDLRQSIKSNVEEVGVGTREGVVVAAVSLVNFLYDNMHVRLPYYWSGEYQQVGINPTFGGKTTPVTSKYGTTFNYAGFDCSGFVSWAIRNGGYNLSRLTTSGFNSRFANDSCVITDSNCIGQPGDLINSRDTHVQLIVAVDEANGKYYVAESTGSLGLIIRQWGMHTPNTNTGQTRILHMDNFYNNKANVDQNY